MAPAIIIRCGRFCSRRLRTLPTSPDPAALIEQVAARIAWLLKTHGELGDCEVWGVLPDEFRAAAADLL